MKTRFFKLQGTEKEMTRFLFEVDKWAKNLMPQELETRVYVVDTFNIGKKEWDNLTDEEFMHLAEESGNVYSVKGFQEAFNMEEVNSEIDIIRFINVPLND